VDLHTYKSNRHIVYSSKYHVVFCPKYRRKVLVDQIATRLKRLLESLCSAMRVDLIALEIMPDHVHLLVEVDPQFGIHRVVKRLKGATSHALRLEFPSLKSRLPTLWTHAYFVSTVGGAPRSVIKQYVAQQKDV
jgi:putative transposase